MPMLYNSQTLFTDMPLSSFLTIQLQWMMNNVTFNLFIFLTGYWVRVKQKYISMTDAVP